MALATHPLAKVGSICVPINPNRTVYGFSFETDTATISVEACVKAGKFSSFTPEKEKKVDDWGYSTEEYTEEFTPEECSRIDKYFSSILA